jgi:hypothetical protein
MTKTTDGTEKKSLATLMASLALLERQIDDSEEITLEQCQQHFEQLREVDQKVDRLLGYMDLCKRNAALYSERSFEIKQEGQRWERRLENLEKYALWLCESFPDVEWRGTDRTFSKKLNPPSLEETISKKLSIARQLPEEYLADVPEKYREARTIWILKGDELKADLKKGLELPFAKLERKKKLAVDIKLLKE